jgi:hypothetical protein
MHAVSAKTIAIVQSNYLPWKGYFDLIDRVDEFVLLDDVQYTRRDWRNRNRFKTPAGTRWLTIPVAVKGQFHQRIDEVVVSDPGWAARHWQALTTWYGRAPFFESYHEVLAHAYLHEMPTRLSCINRRLLVLLCELFGITTTLSSAADYGPHGSSTARLLSICRAAGATRYVSGPAARAYLDEAAFTAVGIDLVWMDYAGYPEYPQLYPPFDHNVSALDLLFSVGGRASEFLLSVPT